MVLLLLGGGVASAMDFQEAAREVEQALSLTPDLEAGKRSFMICTVCHTPEGWGSEDGVYPQIAGQLQTVIIKQLADIRARNRDNPTMRPFTSPQLLGGAQEIANIAAYIAKLPMNPANGIGHGIDLELGKRLYKSECSECHGERGEGDLKDQIPRIQGQHYRYLLRQFEWIRTGRRRNADEKMVKQIRRFTPREETAVLDYVSRLRPPPEDLAAPEWQNPDFPKFSRGPDMPLPGQRFPMPPMQRPGQPPAQPSVQKP